MCDINPDWVIQMIDYNTRTLERIEGLLEKLVKMEESKALNLYSPITAKRPEDVVKPPESASGLSMSDE